MGTLKERFIQNIKLTDHQKEVIAKIVSAPTEKVAANDISQGRNLVGARDLLVQLGLIEFKDNESARLTDKGRTVATEENIIDDSGALTDDGRQFLGAEQPPMESFSFIKKLTIMEGKTKELSIDAGDFLHHVHNSEDGQALITAIKNDQRAKAKTILKQHIGRFNKEKQFADNLIVAAALSHLFDTDIEEFMD